MEKNIVAEFLLMNTFCGETFSHNCLTRTNTQSEHAHSSCACHEAPHEAKESIAMMDEVTKVVAFPPSDEPFFAAYLKTACHQSSD